MEIQIALNQIGQSLMIALFIPLGLGIAVAMIKILIGR